MAGNIKGITIEFNGDTTKLDKALRDVDKRTRGIDSELKKINRDLKFNPSSVTLWSQKQTLLTQKVEETKKKLDVLKQAQAKMDADGVDRTTAEYRDLERQIVETESKLKNFNGQLKKIGNVKLKALGEQFKQIGSKMTEAGKTMTTRVSLPLAAVGTVAANKFAEVDKIMQLTNSTMKNSEGEAQLLNTAMKEAAASSTYGMQDAATATLNFARAGLSAKQSAAALSPAMALAAGEGGNLDTVSAGLVATINGFRGSFEDASTYADVFANACNNSALDINSLSSAMSVAAPVFKAAGYNVKDAALYMGVMANNGIDADKAANSLKTGMSRLISPTSQAQGWMDKLGISVTNADGSMKDSITVQRELHDAFANLSETEQIAAASAIFGKNQMSPWLALINTAPSSVDKLNTSLGATGTAVSMQASMMEGFGGSIERLKSGIDVLLTSLGEALAPVIEKVVGVIQKLVDWFNNLSPHMQTIIATVGVVVAALGPVLMVLGFMASGIGSIISLVGTVAPLIAGLIPAIAGIGGGMLAALGVIGLIVGAGILLYKNWDKIKAKAIQLKDWIVKAWNSLKSATISKFQAIGEAVMRPFRKAVDFVRNAIAKIKSIVNTVKLELPHFKLPHFRINGGKIPWGIGGKGVAPTINVDWYKTGGIFDSPSVIGVGEAGREAVVPLTGEAMRPFAEAVACELANSLATITALAGQGGGATTIHNVIELGGTRVAEQIFKLSEQGRIITQAD